MDRSAKPTFTKKTTGNPTPYTLHSAPYTLHLTPCTRHDRPWICFFTFCWEMVTMPRKSGADVPCSLSTMACGHTPGQTLACYHSRISVLLLLSDEPPSLCGPYRVGPASGENTSHLCRLMPRGGKNHQCSERAFFLKTSWSLQLCLGRVESSSKNRRVYTWVPLS